MGTFCLWVELSFEIWIWTPPVNKSFIDVNWKASSEFMECQVPRATVAGGMGLGGCKTSVLPGHSLWVGHSLSPHSKSSRCKRKAQRSSGACKATQLVDGGRQDWSRSIACLSLHSSPASKEGVSSGDPHEVRFELSPAEKHPWLPHPLLALIPGNNSTWLGALIKVLFVNYMLIVTNPTTQRQIK